jgi:DNA-directed RNA polymerase specialized sigma24 family protein
MKHHLASNYRHDTRLKRGGKLLQKVGIEEAAELADPANTETAFEREWARTVLKNALGHLQEECTSTGHARRFEVLGGCIFDQAKGEGATPEQAAELGISHNAAKTTLSRMRQRYRELLRKEVARLVGNVSEVDDEITHLARVLRGM